MSSLQRGLKNYFLQIKRSPLLSANKIKKKIKRVKSVNALREKNWDDRFIYDKIPLYDSKNDKNVLINLRSKCNSGNRKYGSFKGLNFADNSLFLYRPLSNKTTMNHLFINNKNNIKMTSAKSRDINFRNDNNNLGNKYKSFLDYGPNYTNGLENYRRNKNKNNIDTNDFNAINLINLNNLNKLWDEFAVNKNYRKLFSVIYKELDDENKEELYQKETNELNKIKDYINNLKQNIENRINTIKELFELNIKLNTEIINKDNKNNEIILGEISDKINTLRVHTINVCKSMKILKTELSGIKNLDKFNINLIGEKFNFDKNYLIKMKSELNFLKEGFAKYYFNIENDQTPFLLKTSQKSKISNDKDPFIHLIPLDQELKDEITDCTYYIYEELIAYQNEKVHNKVLRSISPLKRITKNNNEDDAKNFGEREESDNKRVLNEHINNKINMLLNKNIGPKNYVNMSEDNINNKFNSLQLQQINKSNRIMYNQNNNLYFRKNGLTNSKNKLNEENNNKIINDVNNKNDESQPKIIKVESKEDIKEIKNELIDKDKIKSRSNNEIINLIRKEKRNLSENINKNNNEYKNLFMKYKINDPPRDKPINIESDKYKIVNQPENMEEKNEKIPNILPENSKKDDDEEIKIQSSDFDDLLS